MYSSAYAMTARYTKNRVVYLIAVCNIGITRSLYLDAQLPMQHYCFFFNTCIGIIIILVTEGAIITEERSIVGKHMI